MLDTKLRPKSTMKKANTNPVGNDSAMWTSQITIHIWISFLLN